MSSDRKIVVVVIPFATEASARIYLKEHANPFTGDVHKAECGYDKIIVGEKIENDSDN